MEWSSHCEAAIVAVCGSILAGYMYKQEAYQEDLILAQNAEHAARNNQVFEVLSQLKQVQERLALTQDRKFVYLHAEKRNKMKAIVHSHRKDAMDALTTFENLMNATSTDILKTCAIKYVNEMYSQEAIVEAPKEAVASPIPPPEALPRKDDLDDMNVAFAFVCVIVVILAFIRHQLMQPKSEAHGRESSPLRLRRMQSDSDVSDED